MPLPNTLNPQSSLGGGSSTLEESQGAAPVRNGIPQPTGRPSPPSPSADRGVPQPRQKPVPIRVMGSDASGFAFSEDTVTVCFNQQGARIYLAHSLLPDDTLLIKNLQNGSEEEFRVIGPCQEIFGNRQEWGVELLNSQSRIWGTPEASPARDPRQTVAIQCAACRQAVVGSLTSIEAAVLLSVGMISRHCDRCGETARWKPCDSSR